MNAPKVSDMDYIQSLTAAQRAYTCTEAARCAATASHDAYTRPTFETAARLPSLGASRCLGASPPTVTRNKKE